MNALGEIKIVDSLMLPDSLDLTMFINSYDKVKATQDVDGQPFKIGTELVVKAGALEDQAPMTTVFEGQVVAVDADFGHGGITARRPRATTVGHKLMRNRKARVFKKQTISDAVKAIIRENGLPADGHEHRPSRWTGSSRTTRPTGTSSGGSRAGSATGC